MAGRGVGGEGMTDACFQTETSVLGLSNTAREEFMTCACLSSDPRHHRPFDPIQTCHRHTWQNVQ